MSDKGKESGSLLDSARNLVEDAKRNVSGSGCPSDTIINESIVKILTGLVYYDNLLNMTDPNSPAYSKLLDESRNAVRDAYKISNKLKTCATAGEIVDQYTSEKITASGLAEPKSVEIKTDTPEDAAIVNKILDAVVKKLCGRRNFDDYAGSKEIRQFFQIVAIDRFRFEQFSEAHPQTESILMFGPPGTGKTLLAEAVATTLAPYGSTFISITASDIKGRFVGESEKSIKYLFEVARKYTDGGKRPVVLFIDEIDGLISDDAGSGLGTGLLSEFNAQIQGARGSSNKGLIVMAATNYPSRIPSAAFQRFTHRIFIGLPSLSNIREIIMNKLKGYGWDRINFFNQYYPKWMNSIDWNRNEFITDFLGINNNSSRDIAKWSYPGQLSIDRETGTGGEIQKDVSLFFKIATKQDFKVSFQPLLPNKVGQGFFDVTANGNGEKIPWDAVDFISWILWKKYYAPREIDGVFGYMLLKAEQRSVIFATQNLLIQSKIYYQKWLLKKVYPIQQVERAGACVTEQAKNPRYSLIPIEYSVDVQGTPEQQQKAEESFFKKFGKEYVKFGELWGYVRDTFTDASTRFRLIPKFDIQQEKKKEKQKTGLTTVIMTKTEMTDILSAGRPQRNIRKFYLDKKQKTEGLNYDINTSMIEPPYVPMQKWTPSPEENLIPENLPKVLGISQINLDDFFEAITVVRSIQIKDVKQMIEYAKSYGRSLKGGEDIRQLENQAEYMSADPAPQSENENYNQIFKQFFRYLSQFTMGEQQMQV